LLLIFSVGVSREAVQFPPLDQFFDCVPELVAVVGVMAVALMETAAWRILSMVEVV
jgi:hypothetical protein